jgi:hypothetical protein
MLIARPFILKVWAVRAAPTVPEWMMEWPVLIPASTKSGVGPKEPRAAAVTASPGGPSML